MHDDEYKKQIQSYYKMTKDDLEDITKDSSTDLIILEDPVEISHINSP
jgi:hypothetical protein